MDRRDYAEAARAYQGTKFRHQGRKKGVSIDCGGLTVMAAKDIGIDIPDMKGYGRYPHANSLILHMRDCGVFDEIEIPEKEEPDLQTGDLLVFTLAKQPSHLGIKTDYGMVHAYIVAKKVIEHTYDLAWKRRLVAVFRIKESLF